MYIIHKIPVAKLCNRYIYFQNVTKKCTRKNLTKTETGCIMCLNQGKQHSCKTERVIKNVSEADQAECEGRCSVIRKGSR